MLALLISGSPYSHPVEPRFIGPSLLSQSVFPPCHQPLTTPTLTPALYHHFTTHPGSSITSSDCHHPLCYPPLPPLPLPPPPLFLVLLYPHCPSLPRPHPLTLFPPIHCLCLQYCHARVTRVVIGVGACHMTFCVAIKLLIRSPNDSDEGLQTTSSRRIN